MALCEYCRQKPATGTRTMKKAKKRQGRIVKPALVMKLCADCIKMVDRDAAERENPDPGYRIL